MTLKSLCKLALYSKEKKHLLVELVQLFKEIDFAPQLMVVGKGALNFLIFLFFVFSTLETLQLLTVSIRYY